MKRQILDIVRKVWKIRFLERLIVYLTIDKVYGSFFTKLAPNHYQYQSGELRKVSRNGINYELDISDIMDWYVYFGFKETSRLKLHSLINQGDIVFDVGANIGSTTLNFAKLAGRTGTIHSFEPDPINYKLIEKNVSLNNFKTIILNMIGLGDHKGSYLIQTINKNNKGMNKVINDSNVNENTRDIKVTTIDEYINENNISQINLIKIDVEGYEMKVIKGGEKSIKKLKPILFIELDDNNLREQNSSSKELVTYLNSIGYRLNHADTSELITPELNFKDCHYDIIAII